MAASDVSRDVEEIILEGGDRRSQVADTTQYPYRCICALRIRSPDGQSWVGSGWLSGPRTVITAGHCVFLHRHGGWAESIEVTPGRDGTSRPYGSCVVGTASLRSARGWTDQGSNLFDYGAIILPPDCAFGSQAGYFGFANLSDVDLSRVVLEVSGYPADKPVFSLWRERENSTVERVLMDRSIRYGINTTGGQSGAPVFGMFNGGFYAAGIHRTGSVRGNIATRISEEVMQNIISWTDEGPG